MAGDLKEAKEPPQVPAKTRGGRGTPRGKARGRGRGRPANATQPPATRRQTRSAAVPEVSQDLPEKDPLEEDLLTSEASSFSCDDSVEPEGAAAGETSGNGPTMPVVLPARRTRLLRQQASVENGSSSSGSAGSSRANSPSTAKGRGRGRGRGRPRGKARKESVPIETRVENLAISEKESSNEKSEEKNTSKPVSEAASKQQPNCHNSDADDDDSSLPWQ